MERRWFIPEDFKNRNKIFSRDENVKLEIARKRIRDIEDVLKIKQNAAQKFLMNERHINTYIFLEGKHISNLVPSRDTKNGPGW